MFPEASKVVCLVPDDGPGILAFYGRTRDGQNEWAGMGSHNFYTSAELLTHFANPGVDTAFTLITG